MSRIDELIAELCPAGVPHKTLAQIGSFTRGRRFVKTDIGAAGTPCIHYGEMYTHYGTWASQTRSFLDPALAAKLRVAHPGDVVIVAAGENVEDIGKAVAWLGYSDVVIHDACFAFAHGMDPKFIVYSLQTATVKTQMRPFVSSSKISSISAEGLGRIRIPVPPIEVQREIVRVLDLFTSLEAELEAELEARRRQYTYYRAELLAFAKSDKVTWSTIGDVCANISSGGTPSTSRGDFYGGEIPWLRTQEVDYNVIYDTGIKITEAGLKSSSAKWVPANCVIVAMYGATSGRVAVNAIPLTTNQACCNLEVDPDTATFRFVFHWLAAKYRDLRALAEGTQTNLNIQKVKNFPIPVPSLSEQERIAGILDKFDALVNDLSIGLPAELTARRQQYEYYRDRLLTFAEAPA